MNTTTSTLQRVRDHVTRRRRGLLLGVGALGVVAAVALLLRSLPVTFFEDETVGVWVVDRREPDSPQVGRLNTRTAEIDSIAQLPEEVEVRQDGSTTWVITGPRDGDRIASPLRPGASPGAVGPDRQGTIRLGPGDQFRVGGGTAAVLAGRSLTVTRDAAGTAPTVVPTDLEVSENSLLEVGLDGTVAVWSPDPPQLAVLDSDREDIRRVDVDQPPSGETELSIVGSRPVLVDRDGSRLWTGGSWRSLDGDSPRLQLPGPDRSVVVLSDASGLLHAPLDEDAPPTRVADVPAGVGQALRPSFDGSCDLGSWVGAPPLASCGDGPSPGSNPVSGPEEATAREAEVDGFTSGRPGGVLSLASTGRACAAQGSPEPPQWICAEFPPPDSKTNTSNVQRLREPDFEKNDPPVAEPDPDLRARPRSSAPLDVLANDYDPDRDPIVVTEVTATDPNQQERLAIRAGRLQLDATELPPGTRIPFRYEVSDGIERVDAEATVTIVGNDENTGPRLTGPDNLDTRIPIGRPTPVDVVGRFTDPEGDPIVLAPIDRPSTQLRVDSDRSSGFVTLTASSALRETVVAPVQDIPPATAQAATAQVSLIVVADTSSQLPPITNADTEVVTPGQKDVRVDVLANDVDPNDGPGGLTLAPEPKPQINGSLELSNLRVEQNAVAFDVPERATAGQTANITYTAGAGPQTAKGKLVVSVEERPGGEAVIVRDDVAIIDVSHGTLVDLLRNDEVSGSPDALLAIGRVTPDADSTGGPKVAVNRDLRTAFIDPGSATANTTYTFRYCAVRTTPKEDCDTNEARLTVLVEPGRPDRDVIRREPPPERRVTRNGVARIPLVELVVNPDLAPVRFEQPEPPPGIGGAFIDGASLRFDAGDAPAGGQPIEIAVPAIKRDGTRFTPTARFSVVDEITAAAPPAVEARVRAGQTISVPVALEPPTELASIGPADSGPDGSRFARIDDQRRTIAFAAPPDSALSTDRQFEFTYRTRDALTGTSNPVPGRVRVLVVGSGLPATPPVARDDLVQVGPSGTAWVDPLSNDSTLSGEPLRIDVERGLDAVGCSAQPKVEDGRTLVQISGVGDQQCTVGYRVLDPSNAFDQATIRAVRPKDYPGTPPVLVDDVAQSDGRNPRAVVDVLANDDDPDGLVGELELEPPPGASIVGRAIEVTLADAPQVLRYAVTDRDRNRAEAFIFVPPRGVDQPPRLRPGSEIVIPADRTPVPVVLNEYIEDPDGDPWEPTRVDPGPEFSDVGTERSFELELTEASKRKFGDRRLQVTITSGDSELVIGVPVRIEPAENEPPSWIGTVSCPDIPEDEEIPPTDVRPLLFDPDPDPRFKVDVTAEGAVDATPEGTTIRLRAKQGAAKFTAYSLVVTATNEDGKRGVQPTSQCSGRIVATRTNAPVFIGSIGGPINEGSAPRTLGLDELVLQDPRARQREIKNLRVEGQQAKEQSKGQPATCRASGTSVTVTPIQKGGGTVVCTITIVDGYDRSVSDDVTVDVRGAPDQPTGVRATAAPDGSAAIIDFTPGATNFGGEATYQITSAGAAGTTCGGPPCTVSGLTNGQSYSFTITASNAVGSAPPVSTGQPVTPEVAPGAPTLVSKKEDDGKVTFTWTSDSESRSVTQYVVDGVNVGTATTTTKAGTNGSDTCITVVATNTGTSSGQGKDSESAEFCGIPFGPPIIRSFSLTPRGPDGVLVASWDVDGNGRALTEVEATLCEATGTTSPFEVTNCPLGTSTTATLTATNEGGRRTPATSNGATPYKPPEITSCDNVAITPGERGYERSGDCDVTDNGTGVNLTYTPTSQTAFTPFNVTAKACGLDALSGVCSPDFTVKDGVVAWDTPQAPTISSPVITGNAYPPGEFEFTFDPRVTKDGPYRLVNKLNGEEAGTTATLQDGRYTLESCLFQEDTRLACSPKTTFTVETPTTTTTTTTLPSSGPP